MTKKVSIVNASRRAWLSAGAPIALLVLIVALGALATFVDFANQQNRAFQQDSSRLIVNAVDERSRGLSDNALDFASWNDAYQNISVRWNQAWVASNYYSAVSDGFIVFRANGVPRHIWMAPQLHDASHRLAMGLLRAAAAIPELERLGEAPKAAATVTHARAAIDGKLALISVAAIAPEDDAQRLALHAGANTDYLASVKFLDQNALTQLGATLGLEDLRFEAPDRDLEALTLSAPVRDASGQLIGELRWRDQRPGDRAFEAQMPPVAAGLLLIGALTVLLAHVLARRQLAAAASAEAAQAESQLKSDFISSMSHELRTPLDAIIGYGELIQEEAEARPDYQFAARDAGHILAASRQLRQLVDDTLDQTRIDAGRLKLNTTRLSISEILNELEEVLIPLARANRNTLSISAESGAMFLFGDHQRVRQCLLNLAGNAVKFTKDGAVVIRARQAMRNGAPFVTFDIADTGVGISPEQAKRLFEPFAQGDHNIHRVYGGVGLGLAIARKLARAMGGDIEFLSEPGKGACFTLNLPVGRPAKGAHNGVSASVGL